MSGRHYHLYNRGAHREQIFREEANYLFLLRTLKAQSRDLNIQIIAYCLMPNHYHLLVRQDGDTPAGLLPQRVFNSYTKAYNKRFAHSGTLFEGPYESIAVDTDEYLRHLCRYIYLNPVEGRLVRQPESWVYSNYLECIGQRKGTIVDLDFIRMHFVAPERYRAFVETCAESSRMPAALESWIERVQEMSQRVE